MLTHPRSILRSCWWSHFWLLFSYPAWVLLQQCFYFGIRTMPRSKSGGCLWDSCADRVHISFDVAVACDSVSRSCLSQNGPVTVTRKVHSCCCSWQEKRRAGRSAAIEKIRQNRTRVGSVGPCSFLKWCWMIYSVNKSSVAWRFDEKGLNGMRQRQDREQEKELEALKKEDGYAAWKQRFNEVISCQKHWCWDSKTD